jgi:hypothetical protein
MDTGITAALVMALLAIGIVRAVALLRWDHSKRCTCPLCPYGVKARERRERRKVRRRAA